MGLVRDGSPGGGPEPNPGGAALETGQGRFLHTTEARARSERQPSAHPAREQGSAVATRALARWLAGHLATDTEIPGIIRALDGKFIAPAPGGDLLRTPAVLPTGRNLYGFDPYKVPSGHALREGRVRAGQLLDRHLASGHDLPETVAMVLWGTDNMKSEGTPLATALALIGAVPRFDAVGRLCGARAEAQARPRPRPGWGCRWQPRPKEPPQVSSPDVVARQ